MTSIRELKDWFDRGVDKGATHMIVCVDTFDWEDYPVYVKSEQNVSSEIDRQRDSIMEVYNLGMNRDSQMAPGSRVWNL